MTISVDSVIQSQTEHSIELSLKLCENIRNWIKNSHYTKLDALKWPVFSFIAHFPPRLDSILLECCSSPSVVWENVHHMQETFIEFSLLFVKYANRNNPNIGSSFVQHICGIRRIRFYPFAIVSRHSREISHKIEPEQQRAKQYKAITERC